MAHWLINNILRRVLILYKVKYPQIKLNVMLATLKFPVLGFTEIRLIIKRDYKWLAELVGADLEIEVSEEDFVVN